MYQFSTSPQDVKDEHGEFCECCGQPLPGRSAIVYGGPRQHNRVGIGISIALHLALVAYYLFQPHDKISLKPPSQEAAMVYVAPLAKAKPAPRPKAQPKKAEPPQRVAQAITKPAMSRPRQETYVPPVQATMQPVTPVQEDDMQARVDAARRRRAEQNPQPQQAEAEESEAARATRVARANIMGAQTREETGGLFQVINQTSLSADVKFRGWNANFKRQWLQQVHVELGTEPDIETAIVRRMIEVIRKEKAGEFTWESHRLGRVVTMNAGKPYQSELEAFLMLEMFPQHRRQRG